MLHELKSLRGYTVSASDGDIGHVEDLLFDDQAWTIRYLVVQTGGLLARKRVLLSPISFGSVDWLAERFRVSLSKKQVEESPSIDTDEPVSRQRERELSSYYGYPYYWGMGGVWGAGFYPGMLAPFMPAEVVPSGPSGASARAERAEERAKDERDDDVHLRSARHVRGYHVLGTDDEIGHVEDFLVDDETWQISYLVVDTRNWWFGKEVLLLPESATTVSWEERRVHVELTRSAIQEAPARPQLQQLDDDYEDRLRAYYHAAS